MSLFFRASFRHLSPLHELAFTFALDVFHFSPLPFTSPISIGAAPPAASLALAMCCTSSRVQPARVHDQVVLQHVVLHVQRHQPTLYLGMNVDACNLLESQALFVKQLGRRGVTGELQRQQLLHQTSCPRYRSRVKLQDKPSPGLQASTFCNVANAFPVVVIMSRMCKVKLLSYSGPIFKPCFMTRVSDAAEFFMAFSRYLSNCPMWDNVTGSQSFNAPFADASRLPGYPRLRVSRPCQLSLRLSCWVSGRRLRLGRQGLGRAALHPSLQCAR